ADMIFAAATDHIYIDGGHTVDFINKAFELVDHIGWGHSGHVLTSLVHGIASARRSEELNSWRNPVDIASMLSEVREELPELYKEGRAKEDGWHDQEQLARLMLEDDPAATLHAIKEAVQSGATPEALGSTVAYAAFLRMARFHTSNEFGDWDTVHNTLTAANALHQALKRAPSVELLRAVPDTAMSIYLDRFLNIPPQRIPETDGGPVDGKATLSTILERMNVQQQVEEVAHLVSSYLTGGGNPDHLLATMSHAMLREDLGFHAFQIVDAGLKQYQERRGTDAGRHVLIGMSRFLAAHSPTPREVGQTYDIALRLQRGEEIYRDG
ncbi:MAG: Rieske (2Fe-2S) protein, partial [Dehalococcoidia bacterium]